MGLLGFGLAGAAEKAGSFIQKTSLDQIESDIALERAQAIKLFSSKVDEDAAIRGEDRKIKNDKLVRDQRWQEEQDQNPKRIAMEIEKRKQINIEETRAAVDRFTQLAPLQREEALKTETERLKAMATPEALKAARSIALAKHIVDPSYTAVANDDGTVLMVNSKNPRDTFELKDPATGEPVVRKDPEQLKAATVFNNSLNAERTAANAELNAARAHYKDQKPNDPATPPEAKQAAEKAWAAAEAAHRAKIAGIDERQRLVQAVIFGKAKPKGGMVEQPEQPEQLGGPRGEAPKAEALGGPRGEAPKAEAPAVRKYNPKTGKFE